MIKDFCKRIALVCLATILSGLMLSAQTIIPRLDSKKGKWGYVSASTDKWVVKPKFDNATELTLMPNGRLRGTITLNGRQGFIDENGKTLGAGIVFEQITPMEGDAMFVTVKGKTGVANYDGIYLVKPEATDVQLLGTEGWLMTLKGKKGLLKKDGTWILPPVYKDINTDIEGYFIVNKGGKAGITNREGQFLMEPDSFTAAEPFGELWKIKKGSKVGLYDLATGTILVKPEYYDVKQPEVFANGTTLYIVASKPDKWGIINAEGTKLVKPKFSSISPLNSVNAALLYSGDEPKRVYFLADNKSHKVRSANKTSEKGGFYNWDIKYRTSWLDMEDSSLKFLQLPNGQIVDGDKSNLGSVNQFTTYTNKGNTTLFNNDGSVFMEVPGYVTDHEGWTITGNAAISPNSKVYNDFTYSPIFNTLLIKSNEENYLALPNGKLSDNSYETVIRISDYLLSAKMDSTAYLLTNDGKELASGNYDEFFVNEGLIKVRKDGKQGLLKNRTYQLLIQPEYNSISKFNDHLLKVDKNNKYGLYNPKSGTWIVNPTYDRIELNEKDKGKINVYLREKVGLIDLASGKVLIPVEKGYETIGEFYNGRAYVQKNGKWGVINDKFTEIIPTLYDDMSYKNKIYIAKNGSSSTCYTESGKKIPINKGVKIDDSYIHSGALIYELSINGLEGHTLEYTVHVYRINGGKKIDYFPGSSPIKVTSIIHDERLDLFLPARYLPREVDLYAVLTIKDITTGATLPVKGNK